MRPISEIQHNHLAAQGIWEISRRWSPVVRPPAEYQIFELSEPVEITHHPEHQGFCINTLQRMLILILDLCFHIANGPVPFYLNWKDIVGFIPDDETEELNLSRSCYHWWNDQGVRLCECDKCSNKGNNINCLERKQLQVIEEWVSPLMYYPELMYSPKQLQCLVGALHKTGILAGWVFNRRHVPNVTLCDFSLVLLFVPSLRHFKWT